MSLEIRAGITRKKETFKKGITEFKNSTPNIKKKLAISFGLGVAVFGANWGLAPAMSIKDYGFVPTEWNTGVAIGVSYAVNIASTLINLNQQRRLLQNERIDLSQDIIATAIFHGLSKASSLKEKRKPRSIAAVSTPAIISTIYSAIAKESAIFSVAAVSPNGLEGVVVLKSIQGISNLLQAGAAEIVLRTKGKEKKTAENKIKEFSVLDGKAIGPGDIIFEPAKDNEKQI
jgi:hypothetical protein